MAIDRLRVMIASIRDRITQNGNGQKAMEELLQAQIEAIKSTAHTINSQTKQLAREARKNDN